MIRLHKKLNDIHSEIGKLLPNSIPLIFLFTLLGHYRMTTLRAISRKNSTADVLPTSSKCNRAIPWTPMGEEDFSNVGSSHVGDHVSDSGLEDRPPPPNIYQQRPNVHLGYGTNPLASTASTAGSSSGYCGSTVNSGEQEMLLMDSESQLATLRRSGPRVMQKLTTWHYRPL